MQEEIQLPEVRDVQRVYLGPEDAIVLFCDQRVTQEQASVVKAKVSAVLRVGEDRILVMGGEWRGIAVIGQVEA